MLKKLVHRVLCRFGWHDWEEVPGEWEEDFPGHKSFTNARCKRCLVKTDLIWMSEEERRAIYMDLQMDLQRDMWDSQWR